MRDRVRAGVTIAIAVVIVAPITRPYGWDDFPISSYPMFSRANLGTVVQLAQAQVVRADGSRRPATPMMVGTPEPMVATMIVQGHITRKTADELCEVMAPRAAEADPEAVAVEIVTSTFDTKSYFRTNGEPVARRVHARCEIAR